MRGVTLDLPKKIIGSVSNTLLDFMYPPFCLSCETLLTDDARHLCERCWVSIRKVDNADPLYHETKGKLTDSGLVHDLVSSYVFEKEGAFQHVAHALKYGGIQSLGIELGRRLGFALRAQRVVADLLIPIPLHKRKLRERGYNQAELIARGISQVAGMPLRSEIVQRRRFTKSQTTLTLEERKKNMHEAFELLPLHSSEVAEKTCVIVDDVITTGATIEECAKVLLGAGAAGIIAASSALAQ
ncbi:MAG TPA: hypothetical protein DCP63_02620 [Bacteroidetes bacterium]|nr:hypothetical protein [Bacteroidota bacterium]